MVGALLALLALARWQRVGDAASLLAAAAGLVLAIVATRTVRAPRGIALAALAMIAVALGVAVAEQRAATNLARAGEQWALAAGNLEVARVGDAVTAARETLLDAAQAAAISGVATTPVVSGAETGMAIFEGRRLVSRSGEARVSLAPDGERMELVQGAFHSVLVVRASEGQRTAVATVLLAAAAPADRFSRALVSSVVSAGLAPSIRLDRPSVLSVIVPEDRSRRAVFGERNAMPVLLVSSAPRSLDEARVSTLQRARVRTSIPLVLAALLVLVVGWRRPARLAERLAVVASMLMMLEFTPLGALSNVSPLFNAANYFSPLGGPLTANIAALTISASLILLSLFRLLRSTKLAESRRLAVVLVVVIAGAGPFALRDLARGIAFPPSGPSLGLWLAWQLALALSAAAILIAGASAGQVVLAERRGLPAWIGPAVAAFAALVAPALWQAPGAWPDWYTGFWIIAIACLVFVRRGRALVPAVAVVAACGAITLTWGATTRTRMALAERDVPGLGAVDESAYQLLARFAESLRRNRVPPTRAQLVQAYAASELARAGYPARLALWSVVDDSVPFAVVSLASIEDAAGVQQAMARTARERGQADLLAADDGPFTMHVAAVPFGPDTVATIAVPPRTWLLPPDPFTRLTGLAATPDRAPPYSLSLGEPVNAPLSAARETIAWSRAGSVMSADVVVGTQAERREAHVEVELRRFDALLPRGVLLVLFDVAIVLLVWAASAMADGGVWRWLRGKRARWRRSYRSQLSIALLLFFLAPAMAFAVWEAYRLREDDQNTHELLLREALRRVELPSATDSGSPSGLLTSALLARMAEDAGGPLFVYRDGLLVQSSDPVLAELAPFGTLLPSDVPTRGIRERFRYGSRDDDIFTRSIALAARSALVGFLPTLGPEGTPIVLATAARGDEFALDARRADLAILVLLVIVSGVLSALWLSGVAARQLARPIGTLRDAALSIAGGRPMPPLDNMPPAEFVPVFGAFARMATDLSTSRAALEEAQRRTAAVLREVASGVVALKHDGSVLLANPRAERLLGMTLAPGTEILALQRRAASAVAQVEAETGGQSASASVWRELGPRIRGFLQQPSASLDAFDLTVAAEALRADEEAGAETAGRGDRQLRASLTRLPGGAVLTLDDVTELATAQRVLAWGEMARQVAHEIKNPLTPIRLGVQHLRRAWRDGRSDFGQILDTNVTRILGEIDHLDEIARAFSRYGSAPAERGPTEPVDVVQVALTVLDLERMGEGEVDWSLEVQGEVIDLDAAVVPSVMAIGRADELREVLLNLLENARLAEARRVQMRVTSSAEAITIVVHDDGIGIAAEVLPQVFQPHFSTRTSGSGLGLAISRRLLEGWGGGITVTSAPSVGATLTVTLRAV